MHEQVPLLDVREELRAGREPLQQILAFLKELPGGSPWRLLATFEPIPLLRLMAARGYQADSRRLADGDFEVSFRHGVSAEKAQAVRADALITANQASAEPAVRLDNRGLQPPEPMMRVLDAMNRLAPGEILEVWNDRPPVFLYAELAARGYSVETEEGPDGVRLRIVRQGG